MRNVKEIAITFLKNIAAACNVKEVEVALAALHSSSIWKADTAKFRNSFNNSWLPGWNLKAMKI